MSTLYKWKKYNLKTVEIWEVTDRVSAFNIKAEDRDLLIYLYTSPDDSRPAFETIRYFRPTAQWARPQTTGDYIRFYLTGVISSESGTGIEQYHYSKVATRGTTLQKDSYIAEVKSENRSDFPNDGILNGYWYTFVGIANTAPKISGSNTDLGAKSDNFSVDYVISDNDSGDVINVKIMLDSTVLQVATPTTVGIKKTITVDVSKIALGTHKLIITATDKLGEVAERIYTFTKTNSAPIISGGNTELGARNTAFTKKYQVYDPNSDSIKVTEKLNGTIIRTLSNVTQNQDISITITKAQIETLVVGKLNEIIIEADDGKGAITFRRYTFTRSNSAPIISGTDADLGNFEKEFIYEYSATDIEKDEIFITVLFDNRIAKSKVAVVDNEKQIFSLKGMDFLKLNYGRHELKIIAEDSKGATSERVISFTKQSTKLVMKQANPTKVDAKPTKVLISLGWEVANGAIPKIEVCNNGLDAAPAWEDATAMAMSNRPYIFQNATKTNADWAIDIKLTIEKGTSTQNSYITGLGRSYE